MARKKYVRPSKEEQENQALVRKITGKKPSGKAADHAARKSVKESKREYKRKTDEIPSSLWEYRKY